MCQPNKSLNNLKLLGLKNPAVTSKQCIQQVSVSSWFFFEISSRARKAVQAVGEPETVTDLADSLRVSGLLQEMSREEDEVVEDSGPKMIFTGEIYNGPQK